MDISFGKTEPPTEASPKERAIAAIRAAEIQLAKTVIDVADAIVSGEVDPCACVYIQAASAQSCLDGMRNHVSGKTTEADGPGMGLADFLRQLRRASSN
ncbi:MAG: hypothetical protein F6J95_023730 [Leptolyngbya sp. SIO1E4]|nr:hypothetical protein [Leptolyngbya sp. SIO1E4]